MWSADGQELFFRAPGFEMMVVTLDTEPTFIPGNPEVLFQAPYLSGSPVRNRPWDVANDGRFLMIKLAESQTNFGQINVVLNWHQELLERVPVSASR